MKNYDNMLNFGGSIYYIDVDKFTELIKMTYPNGDEIVESITKEIKDKDGNVITSEVTTSKRERELYIQQTVYELYKEMLDILLNDGDEMDAGLGSERALNDSPIQFKIAFNSLLKCGILVQILD